MATVIEEKLDHISDQLDRLIDLLYEDAAKRNVEIFLKFQGGRHCVPKKQK